MFAKEYYTKTELEQLKHRFSTSGYDEVHFLANETKQRRRMLIQINYDDLYSMCAGIMVLKLLNCER